MWKIDPDGLGVVIWELRIMLKRSKRDLSYASDTPD